MRVKSLIMSAAVVSLAMLATTESSQAQGYNWGGIYVGGHIGGAWSDSEWDNISLTNERVKFGGSGFIGGAHAGAQGQWGNVVAGVEVSWSGVDTEETVVSALTPAVRYTSGVNDIFMLTGRLGLAANNWLFYVKGGWASAEVEVRGVQTALGDSFSGSDRLGGWVIGGGVEMMLTRNLILGVEYNHITLEDFSVAGNTALGVPFTISRADMQIDTVMARLSYKFGGREEPAPLK